MTSSRITCVVFDLGETLVDETTNWGLWADYLGVPRLTFFAALGAVIAARRPHTDVFSFFRDGFDLEGEVRKKAAAGALWAFTAADLYSDALPTLSILRDEGYQLAVMANQPLEAVPFLAGLPVDRVAASAEWGVAKPDQRFFDRVAATLETDPHHIAYVGDRIDNDVLPAQRAGMAGVHLRRGPWGVIHDTWPEAKEANARIGDLLALPEVLAAL